ncbi:hypothetical protein Sjap_011550 [Stephania japonica]|uniref:Uncharacterized protein n=1 Tax=Stephania japonica TaxID=461633 RepID=A0AAP0P544_9MAGN
MWLGNQEAKIHRRVGARHRCLAISSKACSEPLALLSFCRYFVILLYILAMYSFVLIFWGFGELNLTVDTCICSFCFS